MCHVRVRARLSLLLFASLLAGSCGGDGTGPEGGGDLFMRFRANGVQHELTEPTALLTAVNNTTGNSNIAITGITPTWHIGLQIFDDTPITTGTYTEDTGPTVLGSLIGFTDAAGIDFVTALTGSDVVINLTTFSATRVGGTFSATVYATGQPNVALTEGSFMTARIN